jgi:hypothetical protein
MHCFYFVIVNTIMLTVVGIYHNSYINVFKLPLISASNLQVIYIITCNYEYYHWLVQYHV